MDLKTYVLHCKILAERFDFMKHQLSKYEFTNTEWFTDYDAADLEDADLTGLYAGVRPEEYMFKVIDGGWNPTGIKPRRLNPAEISLTIKWGKLLQQIAQGEDPYVLVLEDDAVLCDNFTTHFEQYLNKTPSDWEVIYLGDGANLHAPNAQPEKLAYRMGHPSSRCTDSLLVTKEGARKISKNYFPFDHVVDWEIGYQQKAEDVIVYWWEPTLVTQGSTNGTFKSALR